MGDLASLGLWITNCVDRQLGGWPPPDMPPVDDAGPPGDAGDPVRDAEIRDSMLCGQRLQRGGVLCRRCLPRKRNDLRRPAAATRPPMVVACPVRAPTVHARLPAARRAANLANRARPLDLHRIPASCLMGMTMCSACAAPASPAASRTAASTSCVPERGRRPYRHLPDLRRYGAAVLRIRQCCSANVRPWFHLCERPRYGQSLFIGCKRRGRAERRRWRKSHRLALQ